MFFDPKCKVSTPIDFESEYHFLKIKIYKNHQKRTKLDDLELFWSSKF